MTPVMPEWGAQSVALSVICLVFLSQPSLCRFRLIQSWVEGLRAYCYRLPALVLPFGFTALCLLFLPQPYLCKMPADSKLDWRVACLLLPLASFFWSLLASLLFDTFRCFWASFFRHLPSFWHLKSHQEFHLMGFFQCLFLTGKECF